MLWCFQLRQLFDVVAVSVYMFLVCKLRHNKHDCTCGDMAGGCAAEVLLQLEAHEHQDVDGHKGLAGVLDVLGPKALSHQLVPFLPVHATVSPEGNQQASNVSPKAA